MKRTNLGFTLVLSLEEMQALSGLLDIAVKASGLQGAKVALPLYAKLEQIFAVSNKNEDTSKKSDE